MLAMGGKRRNLITGAVLGAALVAVLAVLFGELLQEPAHPLVIAVFALFGAFLGAYAAGAVAYDRERAAMEPTAGYSDGAFASAEADGLDEPEAEEQEKREGGLVWLARRRAASLLKLPLNPWV
jgi:uncharacterized membrane protein